MCQEVSLLWVCLLPSHGRYVASSGNFRPPQHEIKLSTADCEHAAALWQRRETVLTRCRTQVPSLSSSNTRLEASMLSHSHLAATRRSFIHVLIPSLLLQYKTRMNKAGELVVTSEVSRSQHRNLDECLQKIRHMISEASYTPPEPSEEDLALRAQR